MSTKTLVILWILFARNLTISAAEDLPIGTKLKVAQEIAARKRDDARRSKTNMALAMAKPAGMSQYDWQLQIDSDMNFNLGSEISLTGLGAIAGRIQQDVYGPRVSARMTKRQIESKAKRTSLSEARRIIRICAENFRRTGNGIHDTYIKDYKAAAKHWESGYLEQWPQMQE